MGGEPVQYFTHDGEEYLTVGRGDKVFLEQEPVGEDHEFVRVYAWRPPTECNHGDPADPPSLVYSATLREEKTLAGQGVCRGAQNGVQREALFGGMVKIGDLA